MAWRLLGCCGRIIPRMLSLQWLNLGPRRTAFLMASCNMGTWAAAVNPQSHRRDPPYPPAPRPWTPWQPDKHVVILCRAARGP